MVGHHFGRYDNPWSLCCPCALSVPCTSPLIPDILMSSKWSVSGRSCSGGAMRGVFSFVLLVTMAMAMVSGRMCVVTVARTAEGHVPDDWTDSI